MADAIVSFAVERLGDLLISESKLLYGVTNQVNEVSGDLKRMQNFLKEADKKQIQDERVRGWVDEIKELAFRTEDVIELFALQAGGSGFKEALRRSACIACHLISRHNVAMEINGIKANLADIQQSLLTFGITGIEQGETSVPQKISYSHDVEKDFVGMEKEIDQLVTDLMKKDENYEVVSLWGMGGQGKTTLAQKLYNHVKIRDHFEAFAWVCISQQFDREKVLKGILRQLLPDDRKGGVSDMEDTELVDGLRKVQLERKCLVVIDDIWYVDSWRMLQPAFPLGETTGGCKILLTTRHLTVAEIGSVCKIPGLTEDEGWQLLCRKTRIYDQPGVKMANAIVSFAVERLGALLISESKLLYGVTNQVNEVRDDLKRMQNFLKEADKKQIQDERVRGWVDEIKELAFRTEDVIELFALQAGRSGFKEALRRSACITCHLISRHHVAMEINGIKAKLADIQQGLPTFGITGLEQGETSARQRIFYSHDVEKDFVGMEKEIDQLVSDLMKEDEKFEVVSLWEMGGQGKTTLAQKLYNHVKIRDHFEAFAWVCISQQFDREKVLKGILKQLLPDDRKGEVSNMEDPDLVDGLRKVQLENKCLIVIDDIWNVDSWRMLQPAFPLGETTSGCKILLTTRHLTVAEIGSVYKIPGLTEDEGWQLFLSTDMNVYKSTICTRYFEPHS
ncbi:hypothetical protein ACET3Z_026532 [Daucus carota]